MLDGLLGLVILIAVIRGIIKGIGDTFLRLLGLAGGLALGVLYSDKVAKYLSGTKLTPVLHEHIRTLLAPSTEEAALRAADPGAQVAEMVGNTQADPISEALPKTLGGIASGLLEETADVAADKLTEVAIGIFSFIVIMLAVWLVMFILRCIYKHFRKESFVIGFVDRLLGMVLGIIRGLILACIVAAALVPVTTIFAPDKVPEVLEAMHGTYFAGIIYDINPLLLLVRYVIC